MPDDRTSIARSLGEFVGHLWKGLTSDVASKKDTHEIRRSVEEEDRDTPDGKVTLRRTTIEEIEINRD